MKKWYFGRYRISLAALAVFFSVVIILIISYTIGLDIYEGSNQTLTSFSLIHFSGYLFFLLMPVEMAFVWYLDRKSTRLNSSHVRISYAVFCLKKKKSNVQELE